MSVQSDIEQVRQHLATAENEPSRANLRRLHNLLAELMVKHKARLGLSDEDVQAFGGGTPKPPEPEDPPR